LETLERKKVMSSFDVSAIVMELKESIIGKHVDNIYELDDHTFLFKFTPGNQSLIIDIGKRIHLTNYSITVPSTPTQLCMTLRKYLRNGRIIDIIQYGFERIVVLQIESSEGKFQLVTEIFTRGNLILVDEDLNIVLATRYARMRDRDVIKGGKFVQAPSTGINPVEVSRSDVESLRTSDPMPTAKKLTKLLAIGGLYAKEILLRAKVHEATSSNLLSEPQLDEIYHAIRSIAEDLQRDRIKPQILVDEIGAFLTVQPFPLRIHEGIKSASYSTFNQAADDYFSNVAHASKESSEIKTREQDKQRLERILGMQMKEKESLQKEIDRCTKIGQIIQRQSQEIGNLTAQIQTARSHGDSFSDISKLLIDSAKKGVGPETWFKSLDPKNRTLSIQKDGEEFSIGFEESPHRNASDYFDRAKKLKEKLQNVDESMSKTKHDIESFKIKADEETRKKTPLIKKREREWYEKFHWFESSEGFLVLAGRDASTNETLINKHMEKEDIVFHAEVQGAPFVVVKTGGKSPGPQTLSEAGSAAASYSKAWSSGFSSADVYWMKPEQLSKKPPSGQYLNKGMFMVYGHRNYLKGVPLQVTIGAIENMSELKFISGPLSAIESKTHSFVKLVPGKTRSAALAKKILHLLSRKITSNATRDMKALNLEEIQRMIPAGTGDVVD